MREFDIVILGGGVSGLMAAKRLSMHFPSLKVAIIDKKFEIQDHVFHLHKPILEIPELNDPEFLQMKKFTTGVWTENGLGSSVTLKDANDYAFKIFGKLGISNVGNSSNFTIYPVDKPQLVAALQSPYAERIKGTIEGIDANSKRIALIDEPVLIGYQYLISTIALPVFLKLAKLDCKIKFEHYPFWIASHNIGYDSNCFQQLVVTHPKMNLTRVTLFNSNLYFESTDGFLTPLDYTCLRNIFGMVMDNVHYEFHQLFPGRLGIIKQLIRKPLLYWLTTKFDVLTLGRYGAWTYKVSNDVWDDTALLVDIIKAKENSRMQERNNHETKSDIV
jgi:hypothetical protein